MSENFHNTDLCRPFLKWAGNKFRIIDEIHKMLPAEGNRLIEPFAGSAAVFLNTNYERYLISDCNPDLINLYNTLKKEGASFISYCKRYFTDKNNTPEKYYYFREQFNKTTDIRKRSALFVYLNRHGYNGLCRYNSKGGFNVPFGRHSNPTICDAENLRAVNWSLQGTTLLAGDFSRCLALAGPGDFVYLDPPYHPLSDTASFTSYTSDGFGVEDQRRLASLFRELDRRSCQVMLSNSYTELIRELYDGYEQVQVQAARAINSKGDGRQAIPELLIMNRYERG